MRNFLAVRLLSKVLNGTIKALPTIMVGSSVAMLGMVQAQAADLTQAAVQNYASAMKTAANQKDINSVARLVSDDALISLSRRGKTTSLDKNAYLDLLRDSWHETTNYHYDITITNIVLTGSNAKADVRTVESWTKDGQNVTVTTTARATLTSDSSNAVLLRAVAQVAID